MMIQLIPFSKFRYKNFLISLISLCFIVICIISCTQCAGPQRQSAEEAIPEFPWPPPQASATEVLPDSMFENTGAGPMLLGGIDNMLSKALSDAGYSDKSYFMVPDGFALVTRIEQINHDGTSKNPGRWSVESQSTTYFSLRDYIRALFYADPGYFRIIVFIVTPRPFTQSADTVSRDDAMAWLKDGYNVLPSEIASKEYTDEFHTTALIYEFKKPDSGEPALTQPSDITGQMHLEKSGIWNNIQ